MTLATRCPWCETVFRLSKEQAAVRAGMVRCGICGHTFNALDYLVRGTDLGGHAERLLAASAAAKRALPPTPEVAPPPAAPPAPSAPARSAWSHPPESDDDDESIELTRIAGERRATDEDDEAAIGAGRMAEPAFLRQARHEDDSPMSGAAIAGWSLLNVVALLALLIQLGYFWRGELYSAVPQLASLATATCATLGCQAEPPGDIDMITIESSSLEPSATRNDLVTFSTLLRNHSEIAEKYPAIELTLTDSEDHPTVRRVLLPHDYLAAADAAHAMAGLAANSEVNVRLPLEVNSPTPFVGYRTRVFYP